MSRSNFALKSGFVILNNPSFAIAMPIPSHLEYAYELTSNAFMDQQTFRIAFMGMVKVKEYHNRTLCLKIGPLHFRVSAAIDL